MALQGLKNRFPKPAQQAALAGMVTLGAAAFAPGSAMAGDRIPVTPDALEEAMYDPSKDAAIGLLERHRSSGGVESTGAGSNAKPLEPVLGES